MVLAAGMSKRMGCVKQLLPLQRRTLLEHVLETVRNSQVEEIILVLGHAADAIRRQIPLDGIRVVVNEAYQEGMSTSLKKGISASDPHAEASIIVLADQPFVRADTIDLLISQFRKQKPEIVIPIHNGSRGNPVILRRSVFPELMQLSGDMGCRAIFASHSENILKVPVDDPGVVLDLDTEADLEHLNELHSASS